MGHSGQSRWRRLISDPAFRYAVALAALFAIPAAVVERHLVPLILQALVAAWHTLGVIGTAGVLIAVPWFIDVCLWGRDNARLNHLNRSWMVTWNPLVILAYGLAGWLIVFGMLVCEPFVWLFAVARDTWDEHRPRWHTPARRAYAHGNTAR